MVKSAQLLEFSAWDLPDPESVHATLAEGIDRFQVWLELYGKSHLGDRAIAENLLTQIQDFVPKADVNIPGPSKPYELTYLERQRLELARQINDSMSTSSDSSIDTLTPTSSTTSTIVKGNDAKGKGKKVFSEENESSLNKGFPIGDAMEINQMSDTSISTDKSLEVPIFSASPAPPSPKIQREGEIRIADAYTSMNVGVKRLGGTSSEIEVMEPLAISKRSKQSSPAIPVHPRPTTLSISRTINQTPLPASTCLTINPIQSKTPSSPFPRLPIDPIPHFSPSYRFSVDPIQREARFKAIDQHVLSEGAGNRLRDLLEWHFKKQSSGVECVSQSTLSLLQPGSSNQMAATAATFKEASRLVEHDAGHSLMSELVRRYHLANFTGQFEQRKKALHEHYRLNPVHGVSRPQLVNRVLVSETVFGTYQAMIRQVYRGGIWLGLSESFGYAFLALVDLDVPRRQFEEQPQKFDVRHGFPDYIRRKHQGDDMEGIKAKAQQIISLLFFGHVSK